MHARQNLISTTPWADDGSRMRERMCDRESSQALAQIGFSLITLSFSRSRAKIEDRPKGTSEVSGEVVDPKQTNWDAGRGFVMPITSSLERLTFCLDLLPSRLLDSSSVFRLRTCNNSADL